MYPIDGFTFNGTAFRLMIEKEYPARL